MSNSTELKRGDNDRKKVWAGSKPASAPAYKVKNLQSDPKKVGVYTSKVDGDFGKLTQKALYQPMEILNHRPRKCLNYWTAFEVFNPVTGGALGT